MTPETAPVANAVDRGSPGPLATARRCGRARTLRRVALALLLLGVACRLVRYCLHYPFWLDEGFLCVNFLDRGYLEVAKQLECNQVAPLLFLWGELTVFHLLGPSEWAMRLLPVLAGLASLGLFWHLARLTLRPAGAALAIGLLAVARWPITMCTSVKPYSLDLFFALALILAAYHYLKSRHTGWLILLTAVVPLATLSSYPSVFVAGGVSLVLAGAVWGARRADRYWYAAFNLLLVGTFLVGMLVVGREQLDPAHGTVKNNMYSYWRDGFPPDNLWLSPWWLLMQTTGRMTAYPTGDAHGGSTATFLLFLVGAWSFARRRRWALLGLLLVPFVLNLAAAVVRAYPYGGCCRLSQHLAPAVCLLAGCGLARVLDRVRRRTASLRGAFAVGCAAIAVFGVTELTLDTLKPYRDEEALWSVKLGRLLVDGRKPADQVVIWNAQKDVESLMRWHLGRYGKKLRWDGNVDWEQLERTGGDLWCVSLWSGPESIPPVPQREPDVVVNRPGWVRAEQATYTRIPWGKPQPVRRCQLSRWTRQGKDPSPQGRVLLESWPP